MAQEHDFKKLYIVDHPVIQDRLAKLRDKKTNTADFRHFIKDVAMLMTYEVTRKLPLESQKIETPMASTSGAVLQNGDPVIVPILRAGLGLSEGVQEVLNRASFGHIGVYRDENTKMPVEYLVRMPPDIKNKDVLLVDPMLATGHSANHAINILLKEGVKANHIKFMVLVAAPEGVKFIEENHPNIEIFTAALDDHLNEDCFIIPGLGDAGDRIFGT